MGEKKLAYSGDLQPRLKEFFDQFSLDELNRTRVLGDIICDPALDQPGEPALTSAELREILKERQEDIPVGRIVIGGNPLDPYVGFNDRSMDEDDG